MITNNPFSALAETVPAIAMQGFVLAMVALTLVGVLIDILHKKNVKYFFDNEAWLLIRPSGTEPVLRTYAESSSSEKAFDILNAVKAVIES